MGTFIESGFRGLLSAFLPPLISRDPAVAPQQRVILMGGLGEIFSHSAPIIFMFSSALLHAYLHAQQGVHGDGTRNI